MFSGMAEILPYISGSHSAGGGQLVVPRPAFETDKTPVAEFMRRPENPVVVNFSRPRLMPARVVSKLKIAHLPEAFLKATAKVPLGNLHVIEIPVDFYAGRIDLFTDLNSRWAAVKRMPFMINPDIHRLQDHDDPVLFSNGRGKLQALDDIFVHLLL